MKYKDRKTFEADKEKLKTELLSDFPEFRDGELHIAVVAYYYDAPAYVSVFNAFGAVDKKSRWLNKVTIECRTHGNFIVLTHKARTDARFLSPFDERVRVAVQTRVGEVFNGSD